MSPPPPGNKRGREADGVESMGVRGCGDEDDRGGGNLTVNNCEAQG
jgi:hypothetical protein